ncbi:uncharacterized protein LOC143289873 [Babylonia areolata]|uniref:uncharacterized protein LOC143289873 n=1 Tax=Babylonia areolata TaxID=304850 RepID=UPI003FD2A8A6
MAWTALSCVVFVIFLSFKAEPVVSSPQENKSLSPDPAALYNNGQSVREGALLRLQDYMKQGDTIIKERVNDLYSNLKEQLKEGDKLLKERIEEGLTHEKGERKEGDERLKEELDEDVDWLKAKVDKERRRVEDELAEGEEKTNKETADLKEAFEKLRDYVKRCTQPISAMNEDLKRQMSDFQAELNSTKHQLQTTEEKLQSTQDQLQTTRDQLQSTQDQLQTTRDQLQTTQDQLQTTQDQLQTTQDQLQTTRDQLQSTKDQLQTTQETTQQQLQTTKEQISALKASNVGSSFVRWGHATCPQNTSLVYSGVAAGAWHGHTGSGSNYLCVVMTPEIDNTPYPRSHTTLHGVEYEGVDGHTNQDAVCSVCHATQTTTLMIPGTRTCPSGWSSQYRGHLMAARHDGKGRTEYICVDEAKANRPGGSEDKDGARLYHVISRCGYSLPCPPYVNSKVVTCVVCSL